MKKRFYSLFVILDLLCTFNVLLQAAVLSDHMVKGIVTDALRRAFIVSRTSEKGPKNDANSDTVVGFR